MKTVTQNKVFTYYARHKDLKDPVCGTMCARDSGTVFLKIMEELRKRGITDQHETPEKIVISKA